ncbi:MAG: ABC transporter ATP-binding protein [Clostridia bacterium]|nr:ABC transporter ATP-binding protein [Clostridia bacterium]
MKQLLKQMYKGVKKYIAGILICGIISSFFNVQLTKFVMYMIDGAVTNKAQIPEFVTMFFYQNEIYYKLLVLAIFMFGFIIIISLSNYIRNYYTTKMRLGINQNLKTLLLNHSTYLEYMEYAKQEKSQILQRISTDSNNILNFIMDKYNLLVDSVFILFFSMIEIFKLNILVSAVISTIITIIVVMSIWYFKKTKQIVRKNVTLHETLIEKTLNAIYYPKMIKLFNREEKEIKDFDNVNEEYLKNDKKLVDYLIYYELIGSGVRNLKDPAIILIGGIFFALGKMNIGALIVLITYSNNILEYILQLIYAVEGINDFLVPLERIRKYLELKEEKQDNNCEEIKETKLEFKDVSITIQNKKILSHTSFTLEKGQSIYLVGDNGSGKSIIIKVLLGFIPYEGTILIGGENLKNLSLSTIRDYIGVVFQEPFIFSDTVRNNIDIQGKYSLKKVKEISKMCEILGEIENLQDGYQTILGERGIDLSGGQKQRISIARTLIQDKKIIIFDDVLSKLDNVTKEKIKEHMEQNYNHQIKIYITQDIRRIPEEAIVFFKQKDSIVISKQKELKEKNDEYKKILQMYNNMIGE